VLLAAELVEIAPGIQAGVMPVAEHQLHRVGADRLDCIDAHIALAHLQDLLTRTVPAHLRGR
jgi:hypothetical protein